MFLSGLASGFNTALEQDRALQAQKQEADTARENSVLTHLASEHPDPEVRAHALTGLLSQATTGRGKGLKGFFGETSKNPLLPKLRELIGQTGGPGGAASPNAVAAGVAPDGAPAASAVPQGGPGAAATTAQPTPATVGPAGGPTASASTALPAAATGQIGPTHAAAAAPPPGPASVPQRGGGYLDPATAAATKAGATARATATGTVTGHMDALSPYLNPEQRQLAALSQAGIHTPATGQFMGNIERDAQGVQKTGGGQFFRQERFFDVPTASYQIREIPIAAPTALQVKPTYQTLAGPGGEPHVFRVLADDTKTDLGAKAVRDGYITGIDPDTQQQYSIPAPAVFERPRGGGGAGAAPPAVTPPPGAVGAAPGAAPGARGTTPARAGSPGAATPPPGPGAAGAAPASGGLPRGAIGRGRAKALKETSGAFLGPDGQPQVGTALYDDKLGKYYDATDPTKEIAGFIPGKDAAEAVKVIAQTTTIESTIDRAIAALTAEGLAEDTDPNTTAKLANKYYAGKGDDPLATASQALANFVKIQAGSAYMQGTRSFQYVKQIQDHLPVSPGVREAAINSLTGGLAGPKSTAARLVGGKDMSWDSPKQMIEKLQQAKDSLARVRDGFTQATGKVPARATKGAAGASAPPSGQRVGPGETHPEGTLGTVNNQPAVWKTVNGQAGWYAR